MSSTDIIAVMIAMVSLQLIFIQNKLGRIEDAHKELKSLIDAVKDKVNKTGH